MGLINSILGKFNRLNPMYPGMYWSIAFVFRRVKNVIQVAIALGIHLFPFRTEKLSPMAPMVLHDLWESR
jgi:hypothetical protein